MLHILLRWIASAVALFITVKVAQAIPIHGLSVAPGIQGVQGLLLMVVVLGIVNAVLRPIVQILTLPLSCLTFGLFAFAVNALMFWLAGQVVPGFHVWGFVAPLFGSVIMGLVGGLLNALIIPKREGRGRRV